MVSGVTETLKMVGKRRGQLCIDDEAHAYAVRMTGWSLWRAAYSSAAVMSSSSR